MADGPALGTGYLRVAGDFSQINAQAVGLFSSSRWAKYGKVAGVALAGGLAAAGAGKVLYDVGKQFDDAFDKIRVRTGATGKEFSKLQGTFRNVVGSVPADFETAADAVGDLNTRLGLSGRPLRAMSKQMTELSRITETDVKTNIESVSKAFVDWEVKTKDQSKTLDGFFRLSQESGMAVADIAQSIQQFGSPLRQLGFSLDESAAMFASFERAGVNTQTMVPGLKLAISNLTRPAETLAVTMKELGIETGKPDVALRQVFDLMTEKGLPAAEKTGLAMDVFGKRAGADMAEAIKQGRFELDDFLKVMDGGRETIRGAGRETMDFSDQWQLFKNNILLELEPLAKRVFDGVGDAMKDITKIISDPDLTGGEKLQKLTDLVLGAVGDLIGKVAEKAPAVAGALVRGMIDAPIWTKLAASAWLVNAMGGVKFLKTKVGGRVGTIIGRGLGVGIITGLLLMDEDIQREIKKALEKLKEMATGELLDDTGREKFAVDLTEWFDVDSGAITFQGRDRVQVATAMGDLIFSTKTQEVVRARGKKLQEYVGQTVNQVVTDLNSPNIKDAFGSLNSGAKNNGNVMSNWSRDWEKTTGKVKGDAEKVPKVTIPEFARLNRGVSRNVGGMVQAVSAGFRILGDNTNSALKAFGVKVLNFTIEKPKQAGAIAGAAAGAVGALFGQRGGHIRGGKPTGDSIPAMLERDEYVLNSKLAKSIGHDNLDALNFGAVPRFQKGGAAGGLNFALGPYDIPPIKYAADHAGGNSHVHVTGTSTPWIVALGRKLQSMGFMVGEHPAFGGVTAQHSATGGHYDALAIDINSANDETRAEVAQIASLLGGGGGSLAQKLKRLVLSGPSGALRSMGQGALDKVRKAGNAFLSKQAPSGIAPVGAPKGVLSGPQIQSLWSRSNPDLRGVAHQMAMKALGESSGNPKAIGHDPGGSIGYGLWQITTPFNDDLIRKYGGVSKMLIPGPNALAAGDIFRRQGIGAWYAPSIPFRFGGAVPSLDTGGLIDKDGIAKVHRGERVIPESIEQTRHRLEIARRRDEARKIELLEALLESQKEANAADRERDRLARQAKGVLQEQGGRWLSDYLSSEIGDAAVRGSARAGNGRLTHIGGRR